MGLSDSQEAQLQPWKRTRGSAGWGRDSSSLTLSSPQVRFGHGPCKEGILYQATLHPARTQNSPLLQGHSEECLPPCPAGGTSGDGQGLNISVVPALTWGLHLEGAQQMWEGSTNGL